MFKTRRLLNFINGKTTWLDEHVLTSATFYYNIPSTVITVWNTLARLFQSLNTTTWFKETVFLKDQQLAHTYFFKLNFRQKKSTLID